MGIETLHAWQLGLQLVNSIYAITSAFPLEEKYVLTAQMRRAAVSVPSNLAEGRARSSRRDYARFVSHAQGSAAELSTQLQIARMRGYVTDTAALTDLLDHIARQLTNLRRTLLKQCRTPNPELRTPQL